MALDKDCIFCKIIRGEIPSFKVFEDDKTFAFMDINPGNPGHCLAIPKFHSENIFATPDDWVAATAVTTRRVARAVQATLAPFGMNIVQANGPGAKQSVMHLHVHILPRAKDDNLMLNWGLVPGDMVAIKALAEKIRANMPKD
ncbi:MAG: HIT family protein [Rhodospirillales bacterium]|nr:HIT family protein [Rhodospirillales bacterium]